MTNCILALTLLVPAQAKDQHEALNPIYRQLRAGLSIGADAPIRLPVPLFPDGLDAKQQQARIKEIIGEEYRLSEFTRDSQVAPHRYRHREIMPAAPRSVTRKVEVVFIAYGKFEVIASKKFLDSVLDVNRKEGKATPIEEKDLKKRGIVVKDSEREGYGHLDFNLIEKVQLNATGHSYWSKTPDSIVAATRVDEQFLKDPEFPNRWRPIEKVRGKPVVGKMSHPYDGAGYYVKITRLAWPEGAVFVEGHIIFKEPHGWFNGAPLLSGKLPQIIQKQVRSFRLELNKASQ